MLLTSTSMSQLLKSRTLMKRGGKYDQCWLSFAARAVAFLVRLYEVVPVYGTVWRQGQDGFQI